MLSCHFCQLLVPRRKKNGSYNFGCAAKHVFNFQQHAKEASGFPHIIHVIKLKIHWCFEHFEKLLRSLVRLPNIRTDKESCEHMINLLYSYCHEFLRHCCKSSKNKTLFVY